MSRLLETFILYAFLTAFAIYGVLYLAPQVGVAVRDHLEQAAHAGEINR